MQPTPKPSLADPLLRLLDDLCEVFERGWRGGTPPALERLVASVPAEAQPILFHSLIRLEIDYRQRQGRPLTADEAALRFAGLGDWIETLLAEAGLEPPAACLTLRITAGPHLGQSFRLRGHNTFLLGRGDRVHLALPQD